MKMTDARLMKMAHSMKVKLQTKLSNITQLKDGSFNYNEELVWSKWIAETNTKPDAFMPIVEKHLGHDLHTSDSAGQVERTGDKPRDKESI